MKYYNYLFYNFYSFFLKTGKGDDPEFKAIVFLSLWNIVYIITLFITLGGIIDFRFYNASYDKFIGIGGSLLIVAINYFFFLKKRRYQEIKERFDKNKPINRGRSRLLMVLFLLFPFIILGYILFFTDIIIK